MSDFLAAAVAALPGIPDQLVMRSASARATALGVGVDQVLQAWGGGGSVPSGGAVTPAASPATAAAAAAPVAATPKAAPAATAVVPTPIVVELRPDEDPVEPPAIGDRLRRGFRLGVFLGAIGGLGVAIQSISSSFDAMGVTEGIATAAVNPGQAVVAVAVIMAVVGIAIAQVALSVPVAFDRNFRTEEHPVVTALIGFGAGGILGAGLGVFLVSRGFADILDEAIVHIPVGSSFLYSVIGGAIAGGLVGMIAQAAAVPAGLAGPEREAALAVRKRLATGYIFPALAVIVIGVFVVSLGTILLTFHTIAPLIAVVVAGAILTFGFLSGGRPKIRAGKAEVILVLATLAVLVYFMVIISNAIFGEGH